jgi:hypothetical protein
MTYTFHNEPSEETYREIIRCGLLYCTQFSLVLRSSIHLNESGSQFLQSLRPFLLKAESTSEWPGTRLIDDVADVFYYELSPVSAELITSVSTRLFQWTQPELPEDLCLLRTPADPWLVTIAHEQDGYLNLSDDERVALQGAIPQLELRPDVIR